MILLLIFLSLALGISFRWYIIFTSILAVSLFIFLFFRFKKRILILSVITFAIGIGISFIRFDISKETYSGVVIESKDNYYIFSSTFEKLYVYNKNNEYEVGDILSIKGDKRILSFTTLESDFDFKDYLNKKGIEYELKVEAVDTRFSNPIRLKRIRDKSLEGLDIDTKSLVKAIIFSSSIDSELTSNLKELHLMRLLSTSGIYISLFYSLLLRIFLLFFNEKISKIISTSFISIYAILLFPKFSVIRFTTFLIFKLINEYILKKKFSYLSLISLSAIMFMIIDFHITYQLSFILGYSIPIISYFILQGTKYYSKYVRKALSILFLFIYLIPFDIYFYHEFSFLGYLFQLILIPIFMVIAVISIFLIMKIPIQPVMIHLINALKNISNIMSFVNIKLYAYTLNQFSFAVYILMFILLIYLFEIRFKPLLIYLDLMYFISLSLYLLPVKSLITSEVTFINVGQGDSTLIRKGNTAILIDTGGLTYKDVATDCLIPFFKKKQIYNIDLLITTHDDFDHSGAAESLMKNFSVKEYVKGIESFPISINDINLINYNNYQDEVTDENDKSLVIGFNLHNTNYLITGDAPKEIEYKIMEDYEYINCDILKVGHHGSNTSSSDEFIKYLKPKEAIISCGKNNKYGHPHKEVLATLKRNNVKVRRTDLEGSINYSYWF